MTASVRLSLAEARELSLDVLLHAGLSQAQAEAVTDVIVAAQRDECHSHGLFRLLGCVHSIRIGRLNKHAAPVVADVAPCVVKVDADRGFSSLAYKRGIDAALQKARAYGMAALAINRCYHFFALWHEVEPLAEQGLVSLAMTPSHSWVAPAGGTAPVFGTNPIAFAWPRANGAPFVFDFATSATARGEIELHRRAGQPIPAGLAIDSQGRPTTDPIAALSGAMLTFGGHKGSALSAMVELLGGILIGDLLSLESIAQDNGAGAIPFHGELILIFDPGAFLGPAVREHMARAERLFEAIEAQGARLPSQRRYAARRRSDAHGISISASLLDDLLRLKT